MEISLAAEPIFKIAGFSVTNSLFASFILSFLFLLFALIFSRKKLTKVPSARSLQNIVETFVEMLYNTFEKIASEQTRKIFPLVATFFIFILFSNWMGLLPGFGSIGVWEKIKGKEILVPLLRGPTADVNTTLVLALIAMTTIQVLGLKNLGIHYLKKFFNLTHPIRAFVGFLELISEFSKIISFAFRLFGNVFAGEVLLTVMVFLIPVIVPVPFLGLELFVGLVQAFVFTMLTLVFIRVATSHE